MRADMASANWADMFQDNPDFSELSHRNKRLSQRFLPGSEMGVSDRGLQFPPGVVLGQKIKLFFNLLVHENFGAREIQELPLPVSIVATDIGTGERVVFREGSLTMAMRASMSVPGLLAPIEHEGRKLVETHKCESCHERHVYGPPGAIYQRKDRKVTSWAKLKAQVAACNTMVNIGLFPDEEESVALYLNQTYYKLPMN